MAMGVQGRADLLISWPNREYSNLVHHKPKVEQEKVSVVNFPLSSFVVQENDAIHTQDGSPQPSGALYKTIS